jgi:hypothetical protein
MQYSGSAAAAREPPAPLRVPPSADNIVVGTRQCMYDWFTAASMWLSRKGGPTWRVDHVFMWNLNSWDLQVGVGPAPEGGQPRGKP